MPIGNLLAELAVKIKVDTQPLQAGLGKADTSMGKFSATVKRHSTAIKLALVGIATAIVGIGIKSVMTYTKTGDAIAKMAKRTGFGVKALSELNYVAKRSGFELGSIEKATKRMSRAIIDAERGLETYARVFRDLGLDIADLRAMTPEEQFWAICGALADLEDQTLKTALAQEVFGRAGTELLPMLEEGAEGIADLKEEAHELGNIYDEVSAEQCEAFQDALLDIQEASVGLMNTFAEEIVPGLTDFITKIVEVIKKIKEWNELHPELIGNILKWALIIGVGGTAFVAAMKFLGALRALAIALGVVQAMSGPVGWAMLAASLGMAALAIGGIKKLLGEEVFWWGKAPHELLGEFIFPEVPKATMGGIITSPTLAMAGEISPLARGYGDTIISVEVQGSVVTERELADSLREIFLKIKGRNTTVWE